MKTTTDIAAFLKRITAANANTAAPVTMCHDGKVFIVKVADMSTRSQYLDDALENLAEETRRRANNMQPVREIKLEPKPAPTVTLPAGAVAVNPAPALSRLPSISQAGQQAYQAQQQAQYPTCIRCGNLPRQIDWNPHFALHCNCGHVWSPPKFVGMQIKGSWGSVYSWDGSHWMPVAP